VCGLCNDWVNGNYITCCMKTSRFTTIYNYFCSPLWCCAPAVRGVGRGGGGGRGDDGDGDGGHSGGGRGAKRGAKRGRGSGSGRECE